LLDLASRLLAAKRPDDAKKIYDDIHQRNPRDLRPIEGIGEILARANDGAGLKAHYEKAIVEAKLVPGLGGDERIAFVAAIRAAYLVRLEAAGLHVDAIDQWIEIVNRMPEDQTVVLSAVAYGRRHNQMDRLTNYYVNLEQKSFKDVKWPLVIAWIDEAVG